MNTNQHDDQSHNGVVPILLVGFGLVVAQWITAYVAGMIGGASVAGLSLTDAATSLVSLPGTTAQPADAWPPETAAQLPGPWIYWPVTTVIHVVLVAVGIGLYRLLTINPAAIDRRKRLGVYAQARTARIKDLRTLAIRRPQPGRYLLGKAHGLTLATEPPSGTKRKRTTPGGVAVIAPSRSGKTYATIKAVNVWQGPAILSSVKRDLIDGSLARRAEIGEVRFYDPKAVSGHARSGWSPLARSKTRAGAVQMARVLLGANGHDSSGNGAFWTGQAEGFLAAFLWLAANTDHTIADVGYWVSEFDRPNDADPGIVGGLLRAFIKSDSDVAGEARQVQRQLQGIWRMDSRMSSSYYVTARLAVQPWMDPVVAETAVTHEIDLDWLVSGDNTLYIVAPVMDQEVIAPALGGLIGDLVGQAIDLVDRQQQQLDRPLLLALDEAANTPITQLPQWASLLTGYQIQLVTIWQAKSQIDHLYGPSADALLTNHRSKIFYGGTTDVATIDYLTTLVGHEHQPGVMSRHTRLDTRNVAPTMVALTPANVLRGIKVGQALLLHGSLPPIHLKTT